MNRQENANEAADVSGRKDTTRHQISVGNFSKIVGFLNG